MHEKRVTIRHEDGREYRIEPKAFTDANLSPHGSYAERGFEIVGYVDGEPYEAPQLRAPLPGEADEPGEIADPVALAASVDAGEIAPIVQSL